MRALDDGARAQREAELTAAILEAEREEETAIVEANATGGNILRRPDASALAVLNVAFQI
jgi:hypothetical protein